MKSDKVYKFLKDSNIEFNEMDDHLATFKKLPFSQDEMIALAQFWTMTAELNDSGNWVLDGIEVRVY